MSKEVRNIFYQFFTTLIAFSAEEVAQLQQDLNTTLKATTTKLDGFNNEAAEAILADFQAKVAETSLDDSGNLTYRVDQQTTKLEVDAYFHGGCRQIKQIN